MRGLFFPRKNWSCFKAETHVSRAKPTLGDSKSGWARDWTQWFGQPSQTDIVSFFVWLAWWCVLWYVLSDVDLSDVLWLFHAIKCHELRFPQSVTPSSFRARRNRTFKCDSSEFSSVKKKHVVPTRESQRWRDKKKEMNSRVVMSIACLCCIMLYQGACGGSAIGRRIQLQMHGGIYLMTAATVGFFECARVQAPFLRIET